eukprot:g32525.t1
MITLWVLFHAALAAQENATCVDLLSLPPEDESNRCYRGDCTCQVSVEEVLWLVLKPADDGSAGLEHSARSLTPTLGQWIDQAFAFLEGQEPLDASGNLRVNRGFEVVSRLNCRHPEPSLHEHWCHVMHVPGPPDFLDIVHRKQRPMLKRMNAWGLCALSWSCKRLDDSGKFRDFCTMVNQQVATRGFSQQEVEYSRFGPEKWSQRPRKKRSK